MLKKVYHDNIIMEIFIMIIDIIMIFICTLEKLYAIYVCTSFTMAVSISTACCYIYKTVLLVVLYFVSNTSRYIVNSIYHDNMYK